MANWARSLVALSLLAVLLVGVGYAPVGPPVRELAAPGPASTPDYRFQYYFPSIFQQGSAVVAGAGDIGDCRLPWAAATAGLVSQIPGTAITLGDNPYLTGSPDEFTNCYDPTWGRFRNRTRPSAGNHDYAYPNAAGYFGYFGAAAGDPTRGYYSFDLSGWHVVVLNSNCDSIGGCQAGSPQEQWLRADLAARPAACTLAYWHQPRFSSGPHGSDTRFVAFWQALYDYHATVVLNGHDHDYERFAPQDPQGTLDSARGLREFVVGTGGRSSTLFGPTRLPNSEVSRDSIFGVIQLKLYPAGYHWDYIAVPGFNFHDSGDGACH